MKKYRYILLSLAFTGVYNSPLYALPVLTPDADALLGTVIGELVALNVSNGTQNGLIGTTNAQLGTANATLRQIATTANQIHNDTSDIVSIYKAPSPVVGAFAALEGGGLAEANGDITQYTPDLRGQITTKATATVLDTQITAGITADETTGMATGDPAGRLLERMQKIGANIQGEVQDDLILQAKRYDAANALITRLTPLDIKQTLAYGVAAQLETIKSLSLLAQTISYNTAATSETFLTRIRSSLRRRMDHLRTAVLF